ncbi:RNA-directed DNA polymerase, eukaryota, reverse transcriptase zinc-binding domain protein [Tanacetum coccineum]
MGGLSVGSLLSKNLSLLGKWKWRFLSETDSLWRKVIISFYGNDGGFGSLDASNGLQGTWCNIINAVSNIEDVDASFKSSFILKISNGRNTSFWKDPYDRWCFLNGVWEERWAWRFPPRCRVLDDLSSLIASIGNLTLCDDPIDKWSWSRDASGIFKLKLLSNSIQNLLLTDSKLDFHHIWNSWISCKVNICVWRALLDKLATRSNLILRGVNVSSVLCPLCDMEVESVEHCLIKCLPVSLVWRKIWGWLHLDYLISFHSFSIFDFALGKIGNFRCPRLNKVLNGALQCVIWVVWKWRNKVVNALLDSITSVKSEDIFPSIQRLSKLWIATRCSSIPLD